MMKLYSITFSPTGTSRFAAEKILEAFDGEPTAIDLCEEIHGDLQLDSQSICICSVPCYGGRIPQTATERLSHIPGNGALGIACVTYGNRAFEDALLELADAMEAAGFRVIGGCAVTGEHNIMPMYGTGRPNRADQKEMEEFAAAVAKKAEAGLIRKPEFPGNRPYKEYHAAKAEILVDSDTCIQCGSCAKQCPVQAISENGLQTDPDVCIFCMRCIKQCPQKSRSIREEFLQALIQKVGKACETPKANQFYL